MLPYFHFFFFLFFFAYHFRHIRFDYDYAIFAAATIADGRLPLCHCRLRPP